MRSIQQIVPLFILMLAFSSNILAQSGHPITGVIMDGDLGEPLPGATVMIKNAGALGTTTDFDGKFSLTANTDQDTLVISYIGFDTRYEPIAGRSHIEITMTTDVELLEELVVTGYGVVQKKDVTGAVSNLGADDLNAGAVTNPLQQMAGRAAGVNITQTGSEPGSAPSVRIRGITSLIGGNDPLVVVDGVQGNMDLFNQIPPSEIESIDILKDASATAIYGSRGAPGVIIVTTKKAKEGQSGVDYSMNMSWDFLANRLDMLTADQWRERAELWGVPISADHGSNTDWYDLMTDYGFTQNHTVGFGGGAKGFNYRASVSAILQDGIVVNSKNSNYIARLTATQKAMNDKLTMTLNINNSIRQNVGSPGSVGRAGFTSNLISNAYVAKPTDPVLFADSTYYMDENVFQYINPYAVSQTVINESSTHNQFQSLRADYEIFEGLDIGWFGSWRKIDHNTGYYAPSASTLPLAIDNEGVANVNTNLTDEKLMDLSVNYHKDWGKHDFKAMAVHEYQTQVYQGHFAQTKGFINDITTYNALQLGSISRYLQGDISSYKNSRKLASFLGRVNYNYDDRYLVTASVRQDGSSVFGADNKWGTFPSVALAWRAKQESFLKDKEWLYDLKVRAGYGITGNQQGLYPQQSLQLVGASGTTYFNGGLITNFSVTQNANPDLRWETRKQMNIGIDWAFLSGRLEGTLDMYTATTDNLLFNYTVPQPPYPYGSIAANVGSLRNDGIELAATYWIVDNDDFAVSISANGVLMRNEVLNLSGYINGVELNTDYVDWGYNSFLIEGMPIGTFYILENDGKNSFTNEEEVLDRNDDGIIDQSAQSEDRYFAGSSLPKYTYAFIPHVEYKNWDMTMVIRGSGGNMIYNSIRSNFSYYENLGKSNMLVSAENLGLFTSDYQSDLWLEDGDFLRLENVSIGYKMDVEKIKSIQSLRFSITGNNLALMTGYTGLDPELNVSGGSGSGADTGIYPRTRSVAFGLNVTF